MDEDPFERAGKDFKRMMEKHAARMRDEMQRAAAEMRAAMDRARAEMERARDEFQRQMNEARHRDPDGPTSLDELLRSGRRSSKRRRPPRGGEPAPVKPRPKPKPLVDGAEAPVD